MSALDDAMARFRKGAKASKKEDLPASPMDEAPPQENAQEAVVEPAPAPKPPTTPPPVKERVLPQPPSPGNPEKPAFPASETMDVLSASEARKYAEQKAKELGVPIPGCPDAPSMDLPPDLTAVDSQELGRLMTKYTAFSSYLEVEVAKCAMDAHSAEMTVDYVRNKTLLSTRIQTTYDKAAEKKALCDTDPGVVKLNSNMSKVKAEYEMVAALLRACEKCAATVSREISRRSAVAGLELSRRS